MTRTPQHSGHFVFLSVGHMDMGTLCLTTKGQVCFVLLLSLTNI
uniref:Uncharacterized protein n=1 Tax=Anguilla anguilla TaxID=7936 RepID=A0A0E9XIQ4_ANGAN